MKIASVISFFVLMLISHGHLHGQVGSTQNATNTREEVMPVEKLLLPSSTYKNEASYWQEEVDRNMANEFAWLNLYKSTRFSNFSEHSRSITRDQQKKLDDVLLKMKMAVPNSYAFQYSTYLNGNKSNESFTYLKAAYNINSSDPEIFDDMLCDAVIRKSGEEVLLYSNMLSDNAVYNAPQVEYNHNVLSSVEQNAVLVTNGNVDTYPLIMMQNLQHYRTDVKIICLEWLGNETYRAQVASDLGIAPKEISLVQILSSKKDVPLYIALTLPPDAISKYSNQLYCTGLAMKYSRQPLENISSLLYNWEMLFAKENLASEESLNRNYLLPLFLVKDYYTQCGRADEALRVSELIINISTRFGLNNELKKRLE